MDYEIMEIEGQPSGLLGSCGLNSVMFFNGRHPVSLGAFDKEFVIGCIIYDFVSKGDEIDIQGHAESPGKGVYIERVCTDPGFEGKGIGKSLIDACVRDARIQDRGNAFLMACPLPDVIKYYEHQKIELKENHFSRELMRRNDESSKKEGHIQIKKLKRELEKLDEKDGDFLEKLSEGMKISGRLSFLEYAMDNFDGGLEKCFEGIHGYKYICHSISEIEPEYFLEEGDLDKRRAYWKKRLAGE